MKPRLVLLHGWAVNSNVWNPILDQLKSEFEMTIVDLPGYGQDTSYAGDYSLDSIIRIVLSRAPEKSNWVAWSLGGTVALAAAMKYPERFEKLQLVSTTPKFVNSKNWDLGTEPELLSEMAEECANDHQAMLRKFLLLSAFKGNKETKQSVGLVRTLEAELSNSEAPSTRTCLQGLELLKNTDLRQRLADCAVPCQVIAGAHDKVTPSQASQYLFDHLQNGHSFHCFDAGHLPFIQATDEYIETLMSFINNSNC